jgi:pyruvate kinase
MSRKTQIVSTIGPASLSEEMLGKLMDAGTRVFRQNFSHGSYDEKLEQVNIIRRLAKEKGLEKEVKILQDLQGPKIRLGDVKGQDGGERYEVKKGDEIILDYALKDVPHDGSNIIPLQYNLAPKLKVGATVFIYDGKVKTTLIEIPSETAIKLRVERDGWFSKKKGVNLLGVDFGNDIFPEKDLKDMAFGADKGYDWVAVSFIQNAGNIREARKLLTNAGWDMTKTKLVAKIETYEATKSDEIIDEICKEADIIMIARGDMGYEVGFEKVPVITRKLAAGARKYGKESILATQVIISMENVLYPTRAEADNICAAIAQGINYVMTSEETAMGKFPAETVEAIEDVIEYTEANLEILSLVELEKVAKYK